MARESCIEHRARERFFQIREDYMAITGDDPCAAAILHLFEFWTNAKLECIKSGEQPWIEGRTAKDISDALFNLYNEKSVRQRIKKLKDLWFIDTRQPVKHRKTFDYLLAVESVQEAIRELKSNEPNGKNTSHPTVKTPLDNENPNGKNAVDPKVKTPLGEGSSNGKNTVALYIRNSSKEIREEVLPSLEQSQKEPDSRSDSFASQSNSPELVTRNLDQSSIPGIPSPCDNNSYVHPIAKSEQWMQGDYKRPEWAIKRSNHKWIARQEIVDWYAAREKLSKSFARDYLQKQGEEDRTNDLWQEFKASQVIQKTELPKPTEGTEIIPSELARLLKEQLKKGAS